MGLYLYIQGAHVTLKNRPLKLFFYACISAMSILVWGPVLTDGHPVMAQDNSFYTTIDPDKYIVGPGDGFRVDFWDGSVATINLNVTAEGMVLLNSMGLVDVAGLSLTGAKERLGELIKEYYADIEFSISLTGVRSVQIMVTGGVARPGLYTASASNRVSEIISKAGGFIKGASHRNIILEGVDSESNVDLLRFERLGDFDSNPYIYFGNQIHIPMVTDSSSFVHVSGEVVIPGGFEFKEGDNLSSLIDLALGFTGLEGDSIYIFDGFESGVERLAVPVSDMSYPVMPGNKIVVGRIAREHLSNYYSITGQITLPGRYPCCGGLTLDKCLNTSGGLTDKADIYSAVIYRLPESDRSVEPKKALDDFFINDQSVSSDREPVSIDFRSLYPEHLDRIPIMPGDSIVIPAKTGVVAVYGMVKRPGMVIYDGPGSAARYVKKAGGFTAGADKRSVQVIRKTSAIRLIADPGIDIYDGDTILIPEQKDKKSLWDKVKDGAMILGGLGVLYLAIDNATD